MNMLVGFVQVELLATLKTCFYFNTFKIAFKNIFFTYTHPTVGLQVLKCWQSVNY